MATQRNAVDLKNNASKIIRNWFLTLINLIFFYLLQFNQRGQNKVHGHNMST